MCRRLGWLGAVLVMSACSDSPLLGPDSPYLPLTLENLTGRWDENARIYVKVGAQTGVLADTVRVDPADRYVYQFNLDGIGIVRRLRPDSGRAVLRIDPGGTVLTWVIGRFESSSARVTASRLYLTNGLTESHVFPKDAFPTSAGVLHVYLRVEAP